MAGVTAKEILKLLLQAGVVGANANPLFRAALTAGGVPSQLANNISRQDMGAFMAKQYPDEFSPGTYHSYDVVNIPITYSQRKGGLKGNFNQHGKANKSVIAEAGRMQTLDEHNDAIQKYVRLLPPGADPKTVRAALHRGLEEEKNLAAFWNESKSRRPFSVSSSAVTGIRLTPDARIEVQWKGKPTWYTFKQYPNTQEASLAAQELLKSDSIGRAVWPVVSRPPKNPNPLLGEFNMANYDGAFG